MHFQDPNFKHLKKNAYSSDHFLNFYMCWNPGKQWKEKILKENGVHVLDRSSLLLRLIQKSTLLFIFC